MFRICRTLGLVVQLCALTSLSAWDWPLSEPRVVKDFASDTGQGYFSAVLLRSVTSTEVKTINKGKVLYVHDNESPRTRLPWGMSKAVVLDHGDGLIALYGGLDPDSVDDKKEEYKTGESMGKYQSTTIDRGAHFLLQCFDLKNGGIINPESILPPLVDVRRPVVQDAFVKWEDALGSQSLEARTEALGKSPQLFLNVKDYLQAGSLEPAHITQVAELELFLNGKLFYSISRLGLRLKDNRLTLSADRRGSYQYFYGPNGYMDLGIIPLAEGVNRIEVRAKDFFGFDANGSWRIIVKEVQPKTSIEQ